MYKIIRLYFKNGTRAVNGKSGLTLREAKAHCSDPETSSTTCTKAVNIRRTRKHGPWFEGFMET